MATADDIPPIPTPTAEQSAAGVPPVEAAPVTPPAPPVQGYVAPAYPPPPVYAPVAHAPQPPRGLSIASLVCGIGGVFFSLFGLGFLPSLAAVITGHLAQRRQPHARPMWLAGLITGYVGIAISVITVIVIVIIVVVAIVNGDNGTSDYGYYNT